MKLHVISFGCQMSVADGGEMSRPFFDRGFRATSGLNEADAVLVNTCTVRQHAEDKALSLIGRLKPWKEENPQRFLIIAGCAAERLGGWLQKKFPHVDLVVGAKSIEQYPQILNDALRNRFDWEKENDGAWPDPAVRPEGAISDFVTIMRGCNYSCAYCIVPSVRGRELYRPMETILSEARDKIARGAKEIMLLGQTVNSYRDGSGEDFSDLLRAMDGLDGLKRVRFMSPHPYYVNDRMIAAMAESPKICPHLHLPLQSGSDRVLKRMRRNYTAQEFAACVNKLRQAIPHIALTTDVIAGFPGETEEQFQQTLDLLEAIDPCSAYCFKFSPRPGTEAAEFQDRLPEDVVEERHKRLLALIDKKMAAHLESWIGRSVNVLLENDHFGKTEFYFNAELDAPAPELVGQVVRATVVEAARTGLRAKLSQADPMTV